MIIDAPIRAKEASTQTQPFFYFISMTVSTIYKNPDESWKLQKFLENDI